VERPSHILLFFAAVFVAREPLHGLANLRPQAVPVVDDGRQVLGLRRELVRQLRRTQAVQLAQSGPRVAAALGGVKGRAGAGDAYGVGGLGSRGTGQGGGGTAIGIGGLGTKGSGGGRGGYGDIDLGGRGKEETQFIPGRTIVVGGLSRDVINRIIQRHYNEVKYCYEKELTKDPALYGKVTVLFVIDGVGRVGDALVQQSTMGSEPVESCIVTHVRRWAFPAPQGGGTVQVTYPYVFKSSAQ